MNFSNVHNLGVGTPTIAHHFEKQMVAENKDIQGPAQTGSMEVADWDAGWESDGKDEPEAETPTKINPAPVDEESAASDTQKPQTNPSLNDDDDAADAWGWGDDESTDEPISDPKPIEDVQPSTQPEQRSEMREVTLSEPYWISTVPKLVFDIIMAIYDDGAELMKPEYGLSLSVACSLADISVETKQHRCLLQLPVYLAFPLRFLLCIERCRHITTPVMQVVTCRGPSILRIKVSCD